MYHTQTLLPVKTDLQILKKIVNSQEITSLAFDDSIFIVPFIIGNALQKYNFKSTFSNEN